MLYRGLIIAAILGSFGQAEAQLALRGKSYSAHSEVEQAVHNDSIEIDFSHMDYLRKTLIEDPLNQKDVAKAIPLNMSATNDGMAVEQKITTHFLSNLAESHYITDNPLANSVKKAAKELESVASLKVKSKEDAPAIKEESQREVAVENKDVVTEENHEQNKKSVASEQTDEDKIDHQVDFKYQALKQEARIIYKGIVDSTVTYYKGSNNLVIQAYKTLSPTSVIGVTHSTVPQGTTDTINYSYSW